MGRKNRFIYEGAIYHIYQRGNNKEYIFEDDKIKSFILKYLKEYNKKFDYEILAYVIMNNHYHLLIKTNKSPIDQIMFYLNNLLGKYINDKLNRTGHAFEDRYKCELVETDTYLIWLLRYIHRNPVRANMCNDVKDYRWSSHRFYQYYRASLFINTSFILGMFGNDKESAINVYLRLVESTGFHENVEKDCEIIKEMFNFNETKAENKNNIISNFVSSNRKTLE
ncbi:MAG: transposase [Clostridiales bacterium]|jgi:REP element-mobilizing transposase RayT|nr:transposase [Clostridiales bacterium]